MKRTNVAFINMARGFAIILVVVGHSVVPEMRQNDVWAQTIYEIIYSFHMALYMMISGYLFELGIEKYRQMGFKKFVTSKFKSLMVPYFVFSVFSYLVINLSFRIPVFASILGKAGYATTRLPAAALQILTYEGHIDKHIWFIYVLFIVFAVSYVLDRQLKSPAGLLALIVMAIVIDYVRLPEIIQRTINYILYFNISRHISAVDYISKRKLLAAHILVFAALYILRRFMPYELFPPLKRLVVIASSLSGAGMIFSMAKAMENMRIKSPVAFLSKYSYGIYLMHQPFITSGSAGVLMMLTEVPDAAIALISLLLGISIPIFVEKFVLRGNRILKRITLGDYS